MIIRLRALVDWLNTPTIAGYRYSWDDPSLRASRSFGSFVGYYRIAFRVVEERVLYKPSCNGLDDQLLLEKSIDSPSWRRWAEVDRPPHDRVLPSPGCHTPIMTEILRSRGLRAGT